MPYFILLLKLGRNFFEVAIPGRKLEIRWEYSCPSAMETMA
jgi:hypothetical protein